MWWRNNGSAWRGVAWRSRDAAALGRVRAAQVGRVSVSGGMCSRARWETAHRRHSHAATDVRATPRPPGQPPESGATLPAPLAAQALPRLPCPLLFTPCVIMRAPRWNLIHNSATVEWTRVRTRAGEMLIALFAIVCTNFNNFYTF